MALDVTGDSAASVTEPERIREAAFDLAVDSGWASVTTGAVVERADVEPAAFDRHYADVEECLLEIYEQGSEEMLRRVAEAVAEEAVWLEQMRGLGQAMIEFLLEDERRARFFVVEAAFGGERVRLARERDLRVLGEAIDRGRYETDDPESVGAETALAVAGAIFLRVHREVTSGRFEAAYAILPEMLHILVLPYLGEQAAIAELHRPPPEPRRRAS